MDFHSLSRRELQALCKKNKIPANITNVAMADALQSLHSVEGLEDVLITEKTSLDSPAKTEISVPHTSWRTSTKQKPVREEPQTTQISTRTRGGTRRAPAGKEPDNADPVDVVSRKMESQLKEVAEDEKKGAETPAAMVAVSRRRTGTTSVREAYSTRRSARLLEKNIMGLNLDDVDDDQVVEGDAQVVEELKSNEDSVIDKAMEFEGISQLKQPSDLQEQTGISDEKHAAVLEDSLVSDNNEENSLKVELQQKSEVFDESVDDKDADAEVFDVNKGFLSSELTKMEPNIDGPTDGLALENEEESLAAAKELEADSIDQLEIDQEAHKAKDVISTSMVEEKFEDGEDFSPQPLENEESLGLNEFATDSINKDESEPEKSMDGEDFSPQPLENEESLGLNEFATDLINKDESEPEKSMIMIVAQISEEKSEGEISSVNHEVHEGLSEHPTGLNQLPSEENMAFETGCGENPDQPVAVAEMQEVISSEKCDQISSWPVISEGKIVDNFGISVENSETITSKATENINILSATNKENFVKEKVEKVKMATTDMSIRQLKKMLKQLQITDKNTDIKEDDNIAKQMGKARPALKPLSDNCLASSKDENGN